MVIVLSFVIWRLLELLCLRFYRNVAFVDVQEMLLILRDVGGVVLL